MALSMYICFDGFRGSRLFMNSNVESTPLRPERFLCSTIEPLTRRRNNLRPIKVKSPPK
jgi:hypothetical protein